MTFNRIQEKPKSSGIRRVMKQGLYCICGMCGKRYGSETQAEACLKTCIELYMTQESITEDKPKNSGSSYRCSYCKRTYEKINQAKECASVCKVSIKNKISSESKAKSGQSRAEKLQILANFSSGGQTAPDSNNNSATLRARAAHEHIEIPPYNDLDSIQDLDEEDLETEKIPEEKTLNPQKPKKNSEGIEKFYRDGAKYACNKCRKKFFSRDEVISCFDNHGPEEDQLVSGRTAPSEPQPETNESPKNSNLDALRLQRAAIKNDEVKFYRDGAKYVCNKCRKKFFGREEVVSCFDNHGPEEDSWVSGRAVSQEQQRDSNESPKNPNLDALRVQRAAIKSDEEKFTRDGAKYVCRSCSKKYFTRTEVLECFDKHLNQAENENSAPKENSEADGAVTVIEEKIKELRPGGEEKFFRDGAKYVCKSCKTKFFTRPEVIACFDKH